MSLSAKDLASMRLPLLALVVSLAISFALVKLSSMQHKTIEAQRQTQTAALAEARTRLQRSGEERDVILQYLPDYRALQAQGLVGPEQRLDWIEGLRAANKQAGLFGVSYQIEARKAFSAIGQGNPVSQYLHQSQMKLSLGLVHEGDLLRFLQMLEAQQAGVYFLTGCSIDRPPSLDAPAPRQPNLTASCDLSWLTIDPGKPQS